jgi:hypothetical protein
VTLRLAPADAVPRLAFFVCVCGMLSCGAPPPRAPVPPAQPIATNVAAPAGVTLAPCVPRGPELCFNATDDDCNGIIDEGCGVHTGPLQFTIAWGSAPADVNLAIVLPTGERIPDGKTKTNEGFTLDRDCPGADRCRDQNVENIYYGPSGEDRPPRGHYTVEIGLADLRGAPPPIAVRFGARLGPRTVGFDVLMRPGEPPVQALSFDVP